MKIKTLETKYVKDAIAVIFDNFTCKGSEPFSGVVEIFDEDNSIQNNKIMSNASLINTEGSINEEAVFDIQSGSVNIVIGFEGSVITKISF